MPSIYINIYRTPIGTEFADGSWSRRSAEYLAEIEERRTPDAVRVACKEVSYLDGEGVDNQ